MVHVQQPAKILCVHDLSGAGRCSLAVILPVLAAMGHQPIPLPTAVLSTHTGGLGAPARMDDAGYGTAALRHYQKLGLGFDCIYSGYLASEAQAEMVGQAFAMWPQAYKIVDPVMGDAGRRYAALGPEMEDAMRALCRQADLILPNATEAQLLLGRAPAEQDWAPEQAQHLAEDLLTLAPAVVVTGLRMGKFIACAGAGPECFVQKKLHLDRSFPGTGDLFGAIVAGSLARGNALSAAADAAAEFVCASIQATGPEADTRLGVWFEPLLWKLCQRPY